MMSSEIPTSVIRWHRMRKKGKLHFILLTGSVSFVLMGMFGFGIFVTRGMQAPPSGHEQWLLVATAWPLSAIATGYFGWHINEAKYRKYADVFEQL